MIRDRNVGQNSCSEIRFWAFMQSPSVFRRRIEPTADSGDPEGMPVRSRVVRPLRGRRVLVISTAQGFQPWSVLWHTCGVRKTAQVDPSGGSKQETKLGRAPNLRASVRHLSHPETRDLSPAKVDVTRPKQARRAAGVLTEAPRHRVQDANKKRNSVELRTSVPP
jgi:hypothetical protein